MRQQAEILLDADLATFLAEDPALDVYIHGLDEAGETQAIRLALPDPATIIIAVAAAADIADRLVKLAHRIKLWMRARGVSATRMVVRGENDDSALEVSEDMEEEELARLLLIGVYEEPADDAL
jgi:hypothetical protein